MLVFIRIIYPQVDDITEYLDSPPPLKRTSPSAHLDKLPDKTRKVEDHRAPAFHRSEEGLRSTPDQLDGFAIDCHQPDSDSSSDDSVIDVDVWKQTVTNSKKMDVDKTVMLRNPECLNGERKIQEEDRRRYNINYLTNQSVIVAEGIKNIPKILKPKQVKGERSSFFSGKLLSPKLSRLFKPNTSEAVRTKVENIEREEKSRSKFFVQSPSSPTVTRSSYRVRPVDEIDKKRMNVDKKDLNVLKSDLKLASMGKPMTPTFRRHVSDRPDFADGRFSYRDRRAYEQKNQEPKFVDVGRNRIKAPLSTVEKKIRNAKNAVPLPAFPPIQSKIVECNTDKPKKREPGISRSNYVSLANLKINSKKELDVEDSRPELNDNSTKGHVDFNGRKLLEN